ncbi:MAG TPA: hypothetical protein VK483_12495 [Chitinophagaceae bacterium]|nr:hypothetical protein [Chitinophagaceae bacterium]
MAVTRKLILSLLAFALLAGCKHKKKPSMAGEEPVRASDFIEFFQPVKLSYQLADSILPKKEKDSLLISYKIFTQFVPDSILIKIFGKGTKLKIYALGRAEEPEAGTYLFVKTVTSDKKAVLILAFDMKHQFLAALTALRPGASAATLQSVTMDRKYTITKTILRKNANGSMSEGKDVYVLNAEAKNFMLIMTDALEDKATELINPIDTMPRKNKYAADYGSGKMNLVSIRDGRKNDRIHFFIHFEKNNGGCTGELKGEAMFRSPNTAEYREAGDPCILKFIFSSGSVSLKEEGCGSRRGLQCLFDGSFPRKREIKPKKPSKK